MRRLEKGARDLPTATSVRWIEGIVRRGLLISGLIQLRFGTLPLTTLIESVFEVCMTTKITRGACCDWQTLIILKRNHLVFAVYTIPVFFFIVCIHQDPISLRLFQTILPDYFSLAVMTKHSVIVADTRTPTFFLSFVLLFFAQLLLHHKMRALLSFIFILRFPCTA